MEEQRKKSCSMDMQSWKGKFISTMKHHAMINSFPYQSYAWIKLLDRKIGGHSHVGCCAEERNPNSPLETKPCPSER